jgi:hypothetical protein
MCDGGAEWGVGLLLVTHAERALGDLGHRVLDCGVKLGLVDFGVVEGSL